MVLQNQLEVYVLEGFFKKYEQPMKMHDIDDDGNY